MKCKFCGIELRESDSFCPGCGRKIVKEPEVKICENCGAVLRPGAVFCHKCGSEVIPDHQPEPEEVFEAEEPPKHKKKVRRPEENPRKRVYEEIPEEEEEEDDDYEDEDEEGDEDYEEENASFVKTIAILIGVAILVVAVVVGVLYWKNSQPGNSTKGATAQTATAASDQGTEASAKESNTNQASDSSAQGKLTVTGDVNIREQASKTSAKIDGAKVGETYDYYEVVDSWYRIKTADGKDGYIYKDYVKVN